MNKTNKSVAALIGLSLSAFSGAVLAGFDAPINQQSVGGSPALQIADINRDGKPDLISIGDSIGCKFLSVLTVFLGNGDNTFTYPAGSEGNLVLGSCGSALRIGDLNRDGKLDLVIAFTKYGGLSILLGNGDGTFSGYYNDNPVSYPVGPNPYDVQIGDVNRDGKPDLVASYNDGASVLLGNGDGTFNPKTDYLTISGTKSVQIGDVNRDGKPDLVSASVGGTVSVLLGNGDGTFNSKTDYLSGSNLYNVQIGDVNRDGKPDLVSASSDGIVSILPGNGDGTFTAKTDYPTNGSVQNVKIDDVNRDGKPDLIAANKNLNTVSVLLGNGDGTFNPEQDYPTGPLPLDVQIGDINRDGKPDLVTENSGNLSVLLGN